MSSVFLTDQPLLVQAIFRNDIDDVRKLILDGEDVNYQDALGKSPLHAAAFTGNPEIAEQLIMSGARPNKKDSLWLTPLHRACRNQRHDVVEVLLRHEVQINNRNRDWQTPLHICAAQNSVECANYILPICNDGVNLGDRQGRSPLHHAAFNGHLEISDLLIRHGADVNARDKKERRPIHFAAFQGHWDVARLLILNGADPQAKDKDRMAPLHCAAASGQTGVCLYLFGPEVSDSHIIDVDARNSDGNTPLHVAANNGKDKVAEILLANGAKVDKRNNNQMTPLHFAAASTDGTMCMELLIRHEANVNAVADDGRTPLHFNALYGRFARAKTLIDNHARVDAVDSYGNTPLHVAAKFGHDLLMRKLVEIGADVNKHGKNGMTPLHFAAFHGYVDRINSLVAHKADIHALDDHGRTPLHVAALSSNPNPDVVEYLLRAGASFTAADSYGRTPLHNACLGANSKHVRDLLRFGADPNVTDQTGHTPLHIAAFVDAEAKCVEYLLRSRADVDKRDNKGMLPVHLAAFRGHTKACDLLLTVAGVTSQPCSGRPLHLTPLHLAVLKGHVDLAKNLVNRFKPGYLSKTVKQDRCCVSLPGTEIDYFGRTPLHLACMKGELNCVRYLCSLTVDGQKVLLSKTDFRGLTPLHLAAAFGHLDCVKIVVEAADMATNLHRSQDKGQRTALMLAITSGSQSCAKYLLLAADGESIKLTDYKERNCLHRAAGVGFTDVCIDLLKTKTWDIMAKDFRGWCALHYATLANNTETIKVLLAALLAQDDDSPIMDNEGLTPLHWTAYHGNEQCLKLMLSEKRTSHFGNFKRTPLHCAISTDRDVCAQLILQRCGTEFVDTVDDLQQTALHVACANGFKVCAGLLLDSGSCSDTIDFEGRTPLHVAAANGRVNVIELLLNSGADISATDFVKNSPLHLACLLKHEPAAQLLIERSPGREFLDMQNENLKSALHIAAFNGLYVVVEKLLLAGTSVWLEDENSRIPLISCAPNDAVADSMELILAIMLPDLPPAGRKSSIGNRASSLGLNRAKALSSISGGLTPTSAQSSSDPEFF